MTALIIFKGRTLCRINALPTSTLNTTPHLLHTRTTLKLPSTVKVKTDQFSPHSTVQLSNESDDPEVLKRGEKRALERATKRFQIVTKEVDWQIAQAYVALSEPTESTSGVLPLLDAPSTSAVAEHAVQSYLDDVEWESRQLSNGRRSVPLSRRINPSVSKNSEGFLSKIVHGQAETFGEKRSDSRLYPFKS